MGNITWFKGEWACLSNFYPSVVEYEGKKYLTVEHAFQAAKTTNPAEREKIRKAPTPKDAKTLGRSVKLRPDWEQIKLDVMRGLLRQKFSSGELYEKLLATGDALLVEGNSWGDRYWGQVQGTGENHLGKLLMQVRKELKRG